MLYYFMIYVLNSNINICELGYTSRETNFARNMQVLEHPFYKATIGWEFILYNYWSTAWLWDDESQAWR